jgi:hypothetical protein
MAMEWGKQGNVSDLRIYEADRRRVLGLENIPTCIPHNPQQAPPSRSARLAHDTGAVIASAIWLKSPNLSEQFGDPLPVPPALRSRTHTEQATAGSGHSGASLAAVIVRAVRFASAMTELPVNLACSSFVPATCGGNALDFG